MKIGIIAAMDEELKILAETLQHSEKASHHGFIFYTGVIGRHDVVLVKSGIGKVMSAIDRKSTRLNSSHHSISYGVFCLKKKIPSRVDPSTAKAERNSRCGRSRRLQA